MVKGNLVSPSVMYWMGPAHVTWINHRNDSKTPRTIHSIQTSQVCVYLCICMHSCVFVCACVCVSVSMRACQCLSFWGVLTYVCVCVCVCASVCMCVQEFFFCLCVFPCMGVCVCGSARWICADACLCVVVHACLTARLLITHFCTLLCLVPHCGTLPFTPSLLRSPDNETRY